MSHAARPEKLSRVLVPVIEPELCPNCGEPECECSEDDKLDAELSECTGTDVRDRRTGQMKHQRCAWNFHTDWEGDPNIYRGTHSWRVATCRACGAEITEPFPDWLQNKFDVQRDEHFDAMREDR